MILKRIPISIFLFLFFSVILICNGIAQQFNYENKQCEIISGEQNSFKQLLAYKTSLLTSDYDLKYHRLEWKVNPDTLFISGKITSYFVPLTNNFTVINFDASDSLKIDSVIYHNQLLTHSSKENVLSITLPNFISKGNLDSVSVYYHGVPAKSGFGSFIKNTHGKDSIPIIWTLSEPYGAKDWWVCKQSLDDKIDSIDVIVTTPKTYRVASNGLLVEEKQVDSNKVYHWKHRYPIATYLIAIAVTNYVYYSDFVHYDKDSFPILNYVFPEELDSVKKLTPNVIPAMQVFDSLFGLYPFVKEKYGQAHFGWGGGMEHQTMTFLGAYDFELMSHELAHQWFGNKITCASWRDIWLNEGFATYLSGLCYEHLFNQQYWMTWKTMQIKSIIASPDGSVWVNDTSDVNHIFNGRLSYSKGAMLLHMLRWELGDSVFFAGIKNYLNDSALAYNFATTNDLKQHLEKASGKNLTEFFNDWFYGQGFPTYEFNWWQDGNGTLNVKVLQKQSHASVSFFEMDLPVKLKGETKDTSVILHHTYSGQNFSIPLHHKIDSLFFDTEKWLISKTVVYGPDPNRPIILIHPNPAKLVSTINYNGFSKIEKIEIFNVLGESIKTVELTSYPITMDVSGLRNGVYFLKMSTAASYYVAKFVVMN